MTFCVLNIRTVACIIFSISRTPVVYCFQQFQQNIPNGNNVPSPCHDGDLWQGVAHENSVGGGARNPFGLDYAHNRDWQVLCEMDSDGDGKSNGEELGDPSCVWTKGDTPSGTTGLSHPGICEPIDNPSCGNLNSWLVCNSNVFQCDGINDAGVLNTTIRFPHSKVPAVETTITCFPFRLPADQDYHMIATQPFYNNTNVLHHVALFGCDDGYVVDDSLTSSTACDMSVCSNIMTFWIMGFPGRCVNKDIGFAFGKNGIKVAVMQIHWNNPFLRDNYYDSSGLILHYTTNLRPYDAKTLALGQLSLSLPPGQRSTAVTAKCTSQCTNSIMTESIFILGGYNHMHRLGRRENVEHYRNGTRIGQFLTEDVFTYASPEQFSYDPPIEIRPGDELVLTCGYDTSSATSVTTMSNAPADEMCTAMLTFYSNASSIRCLQWKTQDTCAMYNMVGYKQVIDGCDHAAFQDETHPETKQRMSKVAEACPNERCTDECFQVLEEVKAHACLQGVMGEFMLQYEDEISPFGDKWHTFVAALSVCNNYTSGCNQLHFVFGSTFLFVVLTFIRF